MAVVVIGQTRVVVGDTLSATRSAGFAASHNKMLFTASSLLTNKVFIVC